MPTQGPFDLGDTSTYSTRQGGLPGNYTYQARIDYIDRFGQSKTQFLAVRSNDVLTEEQISSTAEALMLTAGKKYTASEITNITITGASKSASLGGI